MNEHPSGARDVRPDEPENPLNEEARLRKYWPDRTWRKSREGNYYLNSDGFNLVVSDKGGGWNVFVRNRATEQSQRGGRIYPTLDAAKLAAFDALMWARRHL
jgi:hypothetical protein